MPKLLIRREKLETFVQQLTLNVNLTDGVLFFIILFVLTETVKFFSAFSEGIMYSRKSVN